MTQGDKRRVYATVTAPAGVTLTVISATVTVYDAIMKTVAIASSNITGSTPSAAQTVQVWYLLDTTNLAGVYEVVFQILVNDSNSNASTMADCVLVLVNAVP